MKTLVTHLSPDVDAVTSIWLIKRFLPGWEKAGVQFVPAGGTLNNAPADSDLSIIHVDTGLGRFDHHQTREDTCAAQKTFEFLKSKGYLKQHYVEALERLVLAVNDTDHFREVFLPAADADIYNFLFDSLLDGMRIKLQNDHRLVEFGEVMLDGLFQSFLNKIKAEKEIERALVMETRWGKTIAFESENEETARLAHKKGFAMTIRKSPKKGHLRIKLSPRVEGKMDLSLLYQRIKEADSSATWFFHRSGNMLLNGSAKNPNVVPTKLTLADVVKIVVEGTVP